mmetsp:Transcript_37320/g.38724  ORF Transcript_37320/g.38724 Transcript_37320/m.38724 type:complete len:338 (+) Transcript_37320:20-1033(+)
MNIDIILAGQSKVGKSSIKKVVFEKMSPHESVYLETCSSIESYTLDNLGYTSLIVRDYPYNYKFDNINNNEMKYINSSGILIYVIDCQDISDSTYDHMKKVINNVIQKNPKILVDIFLHKTDGAFFVQNSNINQRNHEINSNINKILSDIHLPSSATVYKTSIYDHSLFEAFSRIFQKLMPQNGMFSKLLDNLTQFCKFEKSYLFDVTNKIYIAIDNSPIDEQLYETCTDMIDVVLDMSGIYGENIQGGTSNTGTEGNEDGLFDDNSYSLININNLNRGEDSKSHLYLRFIDTNLALICIINDKNFERIHLIDFNIKLFKQAVKEIFSVSTSIKELK